MTGLDAAGVGDAWQNSVRELFDEVTRLPPERQRARLQEMTADPRSDVRVLAEVDRLLDQQTRSIDHDLAPLTAMMSKLPDTELNVGDVLGSWRLVERVASGGMGTVFVAERADRLYQQRVAIKLIHGQAEPAVAARMAAERQLLAQLQHPGIARLYDGGTTPAGQPYLVMEYLDGEPLHRYCARHRPGLDQRLELFRRICEAVQTAHQHLIVHCDLKPANVLVRPTGDPVLLDFGIARALGSDGHADHYCTPGYASPELRDGRAVSTASDVYSLGVLLAELLAGRRITSGDARPLPTPSAVAEGDAVAWRGRVRGDLDAIVARACADDPAQRYAAVADLREDLQRYRDHLPVRARKAMPGYRMRRLLRRRWREAAALALVGLLSAGFVWRLAYQRDLAERAARTAEQVSQLLVDSFGIADPKNGEGSTELTASDVLDAGVARLQANDAVSDPAVLARLQDVLGNAYLHMGQPQQAEPLMVAAADGYLDPAVQQPLKGAAVLAELAVLYSNSRRNKEAAAAAQRALTLYRNNEGRPADIANALNSLGIALSGVDNDRSHAVLLRALKLRRKHVGEPSIAVASTLHNLGQLERHRANWLAAESHYRRSLQMKLALGDDDSARYEGSLTGLAQALRGQNRLAEAAGLQRQILALSERLYGPGGNVATAHNELAYTLHDLGRLTEAMPHYRESLRLAAQANGEDSMGYAISLNNYASLERDRGALEEAERGFRRSLAIRSANLDADNPSVLRARLNLGRLLLRRVRLDEAGPLIESGWAGWQLGNRIDHPNSVGYRLLYAEWLIASGEPARAREELLAVAGYVEESRHRAYLQTLLADMSGADGDRAAALEHRRLALEAIAAEFGADHVEAARLRVDYAEALLAAGDIARARTELARAQRVLEPQLAEVAPLRARMDALRERLDA